MSRVPVGELREYYYGTNLDDVDPYGYESEPFFITDSSGDDSPEFDDEWDD